MSTHWRFECLDHNPPIVSNDEFTQHTEDECYEQGVALAHARPVSDPDEDPFPPRQLGEWTHGDSLAYFSRNARRFLLQHPRCNLGLVSEYGDHRPLPTEAARPTEEPPA